MSVTAGDPPVLAIAGRRVDAVGAAIQRFPLQNTEAVENQVRALVHQLSPVAVVSSAACGADLIALTVAASFQVRRRIVIAGPVDEFRAVSVVDRPGPWGKLFDELIGEAEISGDIVCVAPEEDASSLYIRTNARIIDEALWLARNQSDKTIRTRVIGVLIWEGKRRGPNDFTADFADRLKNRGLEVRSISTL
jgi:hypothetical protein